MQRLWRSVAHISPATGTKSKSKQLSNKQDSGKTNQNQQQKSDQSNNSSQTSTNPNSKPLSRQSRTASASSHNIWTSTEDAESIIHNEEVLKDKLKNDKEKSDSLSKCKDSSHHHHHPSMLSTASDFMSRALFWFWGPFKPAVPQSEINTGKQAAKGTEEEEEEKIIKEEPPLWTQIKTVVILGVHGWSLMGGFLGEKPSITSGRFCASTQRALALFLKEKGVPLENVQVCSIALHGHGKVEARADMYFTQQLPPFRAIIQTADLILVAAHSQGTLVSVHLMAKLLEQGWINLQRQHVSMNLMAGLHHGPFPDLY